MTGAAERAATLLEARAHGRVSRGGSLAPLTSYRLGGPAALVFEPSSEDDLRALAVAAGESGLEVLVVGRGSNMLVSDRGYDGIAVRLGAGFRWSVVEGTTLRSGGAMPVPSLATLAMQNELTGFEFAVAIPASLGGAVRMNAGAHGHEIAEVLTSAEVFLLDGSRSTTIAGDEAGFSYRTSRFPARSIVTAATLDLSPGDPAQIVELMNEAKEWRRTTQPVNLPNGGSVFKNPPGDHAARLIEEVCGKGTAVGGARISEVHANFIVAGEGARANDVYTLMQRIRRAVSDAKGVELEPELKLVGDFEEVDG